LQGVATNSRSPYLKSPPTNINRCTPKRRHPASRGSSKAAEEDLQLPKEIHNY
jgi:hypothetical protein